VDCSDGNKGLFDDDDWEIVPCVEQPSFSSEDETLVQRHWNDEDIMYSLC
jgi:hypothetical protein